MCPTSAESDREDVPSPVRWFTRPYSHDRDRDNIDVVDAFGDFSGGVLQCAGGLLTLMIDRCWIGRKTIPLIPSEEFDQ